MTWFGRPSSLVDAEARVLVGWTPTERERLIRWAHDYRASSARGLTIHEWRRCIFLIWLRQRGQLHERLDR